MLLQVNLVKKCSLLVQCWLDAGQSSHAIDIVQDWVSTLPTSLVQDKGNMALLVSLFVKSKRALVRFGQSDHTNAVSRLE